MPKEGWRSGREKYSGKTSGKVGCTLGWLTHLSERKMFKRADKITSRRRGRRGGGGRGDSKRGEFLRIDLLKGSERGKGTL